MQAQARVRVHVMDAYGDRITQAKITLTADGFRAEPKEDEPISLKYGQYTVEVHGPGSAPATLSVKVDQPDQIITMAMDLGAMEGEINPCSIVGRVNPATNITRMRVLQLFGNYVTDVPVMADGSFQFRKLVCGQYMVIAMSAKKCSGTKIVTAQVLPQHFEMKLGSAKGDVCPPAVK